MTWQRDLGAAANGSLAVLPGVLTQGLLAYAVLGAAGPALGIPAAFVSIVVGGIVFAALGRGPMPAGAPTSAQVLILAGLVATVAADPAFDPSRPAALATLLALSAAVVIGTGVLELVIAGSGLVNLAKFVPQPVLAGFMNGVALLIVVSQVPPLLGWPTGEWSRHGWHAFASTQIATVVVGLFTLAVVALARQLKTVIPATFAGLLLGMAAYFLLAHWLPGTPLGPLTGPLPQALPRLDVLSPWLGVDQTGLLQRHAGGALLTAGLMALIGTLSLALDGLALDQVLRQRTDPRRELLALGVANIASGLFGGLPVQLHRSLALTTAQAGGRRPQSMVLCSALFAVLALTGAPLLAWIPKVVMAGIMVMIAWTLADQWTRQLLAAWWGGLRSAELQFNLAVVGIVAICTIVFGLLAGVAIGAVLAVVLFIRSMNRSLLRARYDATAQPSRRIYAAERETLLQRLRSGIEVIELEGALFFGTADRLATEIDKLGNECRAVVLDFKRVSLIDASGAVVLAQIAQRLGDRDVSLLLAGVAAGNRHGWALHQFAGTALSPAAWHADVDQAVEAAEAELLRRNPTSGDTEARGVLPAHSMLMAGLDDLQCARLTSLLEPLTLVAGEWLFRQGDDGDRLFVLTRGSISIVSSGRTSEGVTAAAGAANRRHALRQRYVSFSPGMMLGETAMLDGSGRTADALADEPSELFSLSRQALEKLHLEDPALCAQVYLNVARHLSQRLRAAALAWRASA